MLTVQEAVEFYKKMRTYASPRAMRHIVRQYTDMANGGNGGALVGGSFKSGDTCRSFNYPGYPDTFFQQVCEGLGWEY